MQRKTKFERYIGIDYSGAETPTSSLPGLRIFMAEPVHSAREVLPPPSPRKYWTRKGIAEWLVEHLSEDMPTVVGIDHGFSFPVEYFEKYRLPKSWPAFLDDFCSHWPTDQPHMYVDSVREDNPQRTGSSRWRRLCEQASRAKSVFHFDVQGSVAKSTHSGIPWLRYIRNRLGDRVYFWPFDGCQIPPGKSVVAEAYPSLWNKRYPLDGRNEHQRDAFALAETLRLADQDGGLDKFFEPDFNSEQRQRASFEGWILGLPAPANTSARDENCPFCLRSTTDLVVAKNELAVAFPDSYPLSEGHTLVVPRRHEADFFNLSEAEQRAMLSLLRVVQRKLGRKHKPDGFNAGVNVGGAGGQTIGHAHLHLIPRYKDDVPDPRGGIRWVIPSKAAYWSVE